MGDRSDDSTGTPGGAPDSAAEAEAASKAATPKPNYKISRKTGEGAHTPSPSRGADDRASRDDAEPAKGHPERSGRFPPYNMGDTLAREAMAREADEKIAEGMNTARAQLAAVSAYPASQGMHPMPTRDQNLQGYSFFPHLTAPHSSMMPSSMPHGGMPLGYSPPPQMYTSTPLGLGGYPPSGGYPPQPAGPCTSTSTHAAPLSWRDDGDEDQRIARELADASAYWKQLDHHPHLTNPTTKPEWTGMNESGGLPYIEGANMYVSTTLTPGTMFAGEQGSGRWAEKREAVTILLTEKSNRTPYAAEDIRASVASEIERIGGFDDACLDGDLPSMMTSYGPYKVTMAAEAAQSLIESEGVTLFRHDPQQGLCDEKDFNIEILLPSGKQYPLDRSARQAREERPRKEFDKTHRVRFHLNIPSGLAARKETERTAAMVRLHAHLRRHFKMHGANNIGFHKARNDKTGRFANTLTGFVNHPAEVTRKDFIVKAFYDIKYFNAALGDLAKINLSREDLTAANIQQCCFRTNCTKQPGMRCNVFMELMRRHDMLPPTQTVERVGDKRKMNEPTSEQMAQREAEKKAFKEKRREPDCRAHAKGRCINGSECKHPHSADPAGIMCNSTIAVGVKASHNNKTYGWCHLNAKGMECPYKDCIHSMSLDSPAHDTTVSDEQAAIEEAAAVAALEEMDAM